MFISYAGNLSHLLVIIVTDNTLQHTAFGLANRYFVMRLASVLRIVHTEITYQYPSHHEQRFGLKPHVCINKDQCFNYRTVLQIRGKRANLGIGPPRFLTDLIRPILLLNSEIFLIFSVNI